MIAAVTKNLANPLPDAYVQAVFPTLMQLLLQTEDKEILQVFSPSFFLLVWKDTLGMNRMDKFA